MKLNLIDNKTSKFFLIKVKKNERIDLIKLI